MRLIPVADDMDSELTRPVVTLEVEQDGTYIVSIVPPLASGNHRQAFGTKDEAWHGARIL